MLTYTVRSTTVVNDVIFGWRGREGWGVLADLEIVELYVCEWQAVGCNLHDDVGDDDNMAMSCHCVLIVFIEFILQDTNGGELLLKVDVTMKKVRIYGWNYHYIFYCIKQM